MYVLAIDGIENFMAHVDKCDRAFSGACVASSGYCDTRGCLAVLCSSVLTTAAPGAWGMKPGYSCWGPGGMWG